MNCIHVLWVNADIVVSFLDVDTFYGHFLLVYLEVLSFPFFVAFLCLWIINEIELVPFSNCKERLLILVCSCLFSNLVF